MNKPFSILFGVLLILMGGVGLLFTLVLPSLGLNAWRWGLWQLWPLVVVCAGLVFMISPLLARDKRGLGGLFIPGMPILTTGAILMFASVTGIWHIWTWAWPLEVLAVASGFLLAALYMREVGLLFPAIIVGLNGLVLQFCAITGLWHLWSVLWTVEPLAAGLSLMLVSVRARSSAVFLVGAALCSFAGIAFVGMTALELAGGWLFNLIGPAILVLTGLALLIWGVLPRSSGQRAAA